MRSRLLIPLIVLALSACGEVIPADEGSTTAATTATTFTTTTTATTTTTTTTATTTTTTTAPQATTSSYPAAPQLELRGDGLGPLDFGTPTAEVMETLTGMLGEPSPGEEYPYGGHPLRHVYWDQLGLSVIFSEYDFYRSDGLEHLAGWGHGSKPPGEPAVPGASWTLKTANGVGIGSTLEELQAAYGNRLFLEEAPCDGIPTSAYVTGTQEDDRGFRLMLYFDRLTSDPAAKAVALGAGAGPGC
jgi:hypothetical protein